MSRSGKTLRLAAAAIFFAASAPAVARAAAADLVEEWTVDPGTVGMLVADHRVPAVTVRLEFAAGAFSPWLVESFAGTAFALQMRDTDGELRRRADALAVQISLGVANRSSTLALSCHKADLPQALALVRDLLANRDFERAELVRRRQSTRIEWKAALEEPEFVLAQAGARLLFRADDPRRWPFEEPPLPPVDVERLAAARDGLVRLPGRVVGFAGDLTSAEARSLAVHLLPDPIAALPDDVTPRLGPVPPSGERAREVFAALPRLTQTYFAYVRESVSWLDPDYPASMIADEVLGGHFNSRLMTALRHEGGETYGAGVHDSGDIDPGVYALGTFTRTENAARTEQKLRETLATFHAGGITEDERSAVAGYLLGRRAFARQSPSQILSTRMRERRLGVAVGFFDEAAAKAAALPLDEINRFIRRFHDPQRFTMIQVRAR